MGRQYDKQHAITVIAVAAVLANRFASFGGGYASGAAGAGGNTDSAGVFESNAAIGEAVPVVTGYSGLVEAGADLVAGFVKPGTDGKAVQGSITDNCGRITSAGLTGTLVEVILQPHIHPTT